VRPGRELLEGRIEVDETLIGGTAEGERGGRGAAGKSLVAIAIELRDPKGFGKCRMARIPDATTESLRDFLAGNVEPGSTVVTDGWQAYKKATSGVFTHERFVAPYKQGPVLLPAVHRVASLTKRWLLGTHQGSIDEGHLPLYLDEFVFRFNRRTSKSRGLVFYRLMQLAVGHDPVRYRDLILQPTPGSKKSHPPGSRGRPQSLERNGVGKPWRAPADQDWSA